MKWPTIFEWLWDMNLYAPVFPERQVYVYPWAWPAMTVVLIVYCWIYRWRYRKKNRWRSVINLTEGE